MKKHTKQTPEKAGTTISNCTFTNLPPDADMVAAVTAVARASEAHAVALQKAVAILAGSTAPMLQITQPND